MSVNTAKLVLIYHDSSFYVSNYQISAATDTVILENPNNNLKYTQYNQKSFINIELLPLTRCESVTFVFTKITNYDIELFLK